MSQYVVKYPKQSKDGYGPGKQIDWEITYQGYEIVPNEIYVSGELEVYSSAGGISPVGLINDELDVQWDGKVGVHNLFETWSTSFQKKGLVENVNNYPRFVRMMTDSQLDKNDLMNSQYTCELRTANDQLSRSILRGEGYGSADTKASRFFMRPLIGINRLSGAPVAESNFGIMHLQTRLSTVPSCLFGDDVGTATTYILNNVKLHYKIRPQGSYNQPTIMKSFSVIPKLIESTNSTLQVQNPVISNAVSISFLKTDHDLNTGFNQNATETLPNLERCEFIMNDQTNSYLSFPLTNITEMLWNGVLSFGNTTHTEVNSDNVERGQCCVLGLRFPQTMNFLRSNMTFNVLSNANNTNRYNCYMFFHTDLVV